MPKFKVAFDTEVIVEIDPTVFTQEKLEEFRQHFYKLDTIKEHAEHIAQLIVRDMDSSRSASRLWEGKKIYATLHFLEGYGYILKDDETSDDLYAFGEPWSGIRVRYNDLDFDAEAEEMK